MRLVGRTLTIRWDADSTVNAARIIAHVVFMAKQEIPAIIQLSKPGKIGYKLGIPFLPHGAHHHSLLEDHFTYV